jgi:hypothetical protein
MDVPDSWASRPKVLGAVEELLAELKSGASAEWENDTLDSFLEAFGALLDAMENAYHNEKLPMETDPWVVVAEALRGARYYE